LPVTLLSDGEEHREQKKKILTHLEGFVFASGIRGLDVEAAAVNPRSSIAQPASQVLPVVPPERTKESSEERRERRKWKKECCCWLLLIRWGTNKERRIYRQVRNSKVV
jgi:hypothetical protein